MSVPPRPSSGQTAARRGQPVVGAGEVDLDPALKAKLPGRDPAALAAFFEAYFPRIYGYVRGLVRDEHLAEDLTQDIFLLLHRGLPSYDPARELRPWVFAVVVNRVRDHWRSRRGRRELERTSLGEEESPEIASADPGPLEPLLAAETGDGVRAAVERLPEGLREVLYLRAFEGLEFEAISALIERNEVAVRKRYSRGLAELRKLLEGQA